MAVDDTEKKVLDSVAEQLRAIASGLSGNRASELHRLTDLIDAVSGSKALDNLALTLADRAKGSVDPNADKALDPAFSGPQASAPQQMQVNTT